MMSSYRETTGTSIKEAFRAFHDANPHVYREFKNLAFKAIRANRKRISSKQIIGVLRWEFSLKTEDESFVTVDGEKRSFKINDAFTSHYARLFSKEFPEYADRFEKRRLRSERDAEDLFDLVGI
jgi:hypothetical protein